ncbi:MAG: hypothetical protein R3F17_03135 [Planctomycetota bacterium]
MEIHDRPRVVDPANPDANAFDREYYNKMRMWIWQNRGDHIKVMREVLHSGGEGDFKLLGKRLTFSVWTEGQFSTVPAVRTLFTHNAGHMSCRTCTARFAKILGALVRRRGWALVRVRTLWQRSTCLEEATLNKLYSRGI